jgi:hypothetical protein
MDTDNVDGTVILTIEAVKLYNIVGFEAKLLEKAPLYVLFLPSYSSFIIQIGQFNYNLAKDIPIKAKVTKNKSGYPKYFVPHLEGDYMIKVSKVVSPEALSSLETIFNNNCRLSYEEEVGAEEEKKPEPKKEVQGQETVKESVKNYIVNENQGIKTKIASTVITKGGEYTKIGIVKAAGLISMGIRGLTSLFTAVSSKKEEEKQPDEMVVAGFKVANQASEVVCRITVTQVTNVINMSKMIAKEVSKRAENTETVKRFENYEHHDTVVELGKSTLSAIGDIYGGVLDALSIVGKEIGNSATNIVTHTCGETAGEVTRQGVDTVGNVASAVTGIQKEAIKVIKELGSKGEN